MTPTTILNNKIAADSFWAGLGKNFDNYRQVLCEFIDNSISNIKGNTAQLKQRQINITLIEQEDGSVETSVEDTGTGIKHPDHAFSIGDCEAPDSTLNEHGFGFKHALAKADPNNCNWLIATKSNDIETGNFLLIKAPFKLENQPATLCPITSWPGNLPSPTGTLFRFTCTEHLFDTIERGHLGFDRRVEKLIELLGFTYSGIIIEGGLNITVFSTNRSGSSNQYSVGAVLPDWDDVSYDEQNNKLKGEEEFDLGGGTVSIRYHFGQITKSENNSYFYLCNQRTSGVEIRINGRILQNNLLTQVWPTTEQHNRFNHFLVVIDVHSDNPDALPATVTTKSNLSSDDEKLVNLYAWIRRKMREPEADGSDRYSRTERETFEKLKENIMRYRLDADAKTEVATYQSLGVSGEPIDLYVASSHSIEIYEGKKKTTRPLDLFQLLMYWNGCICDDPDNAPALGFLIAPEHSDAVKKITTYVNEHMKDSLGHCYKIELKTWADYNLRNPE